MDDKLYILIAGTGETSRANVEALLEDTMYTHKNNVAFVLVYNKNATQGHKFVAQLAKDKSNDIILFANEDANFEGIPGATFNDSDEPVKDALKFLKGKKAEAYLLWNDEDERMIATVNDCHKAKVKAFDLTDGLVPLEKIDQEPTPAPTMPEIETMVKEDEEDEEDISDFSDEEDEEDDEPDIEDDLYYGVNALVKAIARAVVEELRNTPEDAPKKAQKAPKK